MLYSFLVIDASAGTFVQKILEVMENFPDYWYLGACAPDHALSEIIRMKPQVVFAIGAGGAKDSHFSYRVIASMHQYVEIMPYIIAVEPDAAHALEALQSGVSDYMVGGLELHAAGPSLKRFEMKSRNVLQTSVCIKSHSDYQFVELRDIVFLKADNNTTDIHLSNGRVVNAYKTLKHFEDSFPFYFLRVHKSYIVNSNFVSRIHIGKGKCYLNYNQIVPFSPGYRHSIDVILEKMNRTGRHA